MARSAVRKAAVGLLVGGVSGFTPFAGVEELKPQRLEQHCEPKTFPSLDGKFQLRKCSRVVRKRLEDGGDVLLGWTMHVDPDSILSLDTEAERGVRLSRCSPDGLELELPESHTRHAISGKIIVGSRFVHSCEHLQGRHLYHRVKEVKEHKWKDVSEEGGRGRRASVHLLTEELPNFAHAVEYLDFHFSYVPAEARDVVPYPKMKTDYGVNREHLEKTSSGGSASNSERRLDMFPSLSGMLKKMENMQIDGVEKDSGGFQHGGHTQAKISTENDLLSLMPKQVSNFGWNWDFAMNSTQEPEINITGPGTQGFFVLKKPAIKVHAGIYVNFTSRFYGPFTTPHVRWTAGIAGHGHVQGRIIAALNTTGDAGVDPTTFKSLDLPILERLRDPIWFKKIDISTGNMPITVEPGWQLKAKLYHNGEFKGAAVFGGKTHGTMNPSLSFDSLTGFTTNWKGELLDTDIWPPMWIIFTKRFELGVMLRPSILMRGDMFGLEQATMAIDAAPYLNLTIKREASNASTSSAGGAAPVASATKVLTVYPFRVMGLENVEFHTRYKVKVTCGNMSITTSPEINWGQVQFRDHISKFDCGSMLEKAVLEQNLAISLIEVRDASDPILPAEERVLGTGTVKCTSMLNGECQPSPAVANILSSSGIPVASVQLVIIWKDTPQPWFASKIRGISLSFPQVVLRQDSLAGKLDRVSTRRPSLRLVHGGRTFVTDIIGDISSQQSPLSGEKTFEFAPSFIDTWLPCPRSVETCHSPRLELYAQDVLLASATLPQLDWTSQGALQGSTGTFMERTGGSEVNVPATVALRAPGTDYSTVAVVKMNARVFDPALSSLFLKPNARKQVGLNSQEPIQWLVADVDANKEYSFTVSALKLVEDFDSETNSKYNEIGDLALIPIAGSSRVEKRKCKKTSLPGMPDSLAPCAFSVDWLFDSSVYEESSQIVLNVAWSDGTTVHEMYTPALEVASRARRLEESDEETEALEALEAMGMPSPRRLKWTSQSWNDHIAQNKEQCDQKDLEFKLGAGLLVRGRVDSFGLPQGFPMPMLGELDEAPVMTTGWHRVGGVKEGHNAADLFPEILCDGGLCQGALPGCREAQFKQLHFPRLVFDFNRPYLYDQNATGKFSKTMHQVLAYAFSTLPEMVDVTIRELNQSNHLPWQHNKKPESRWSTGSLLDEPLRRPTSYGGYQAPSPAAAPMWTLPATPPTPKPVPAEAAAAFNKWWSGAQRRLQESGVVGHQAELRFKKGLPYMVDRPLVEMMLQRGYFMEIEDDATPELGPLRIVNFHIDLSDDSGASAQSARAGFMQAPTAMAAMLGVAASVFVLLGAWMSRALDLRIFPQRTVPAKRLFLDCQDAETEGLE